MLLAYKNKGNYMTNNIDDTQITNKDYLTITTDGVCCGGKPTTKYRGEDIKFVNELPQKFAEFISGYKNKPSQMHILSSVSNYNSDENEPVVLSPEHGDVLFVRFVFDEGIKTRWIKYKLYSNKSVCAQHGPYNCIRSADMFTSCTEFFGPKITKIGKFFPLEFHPKNDENKDVVATKPAKRTRKKKVESVSLVCDVPEKDTSIEIDLGKYKLQLQIHATLVMKENVK